MLDLASCDNTAEGIQKFNRTVFGTELHPGQLDFTLSATKQVNLLSPGNSWGKTEWVARELVRRCWLKLGAVEPDDMEGWLLSPYNALCAAFNYDIAEEAFNRLDHMYRAGGPLSFLIEQLWVSKPQKIRFTNGSVLDFGSLGEGGRLIEATRRHVIFVDEVGQVPEFEEVFNSVIYPRTIGVNGDVFLVGTPKPHTDSFIHEIFDVGLTGDDPFYFAREGSSFENIYWPAEEQARVLKNPKLVRRVNEDGTVEFTDLGRQVILGKFRLAGGLFFNRLRVSRMFSGDWRFDEVKPSPKGVYLAAADLGGRKKKSDATVVMVMDVSSFPWRLVSYQRLEGTDADWEDKYDAIEAVYDEWRPPYFLLDVTGQQDSVAEVLEKRGIPVEGVNFGGALGSKKLNMLRSLQSVLEMDFKDSDGNSVRGLIRCPAVVVEPDMRQPKTEMERYALADKNLTQDCVMTLAMLAHYALQEQVPEPTFGDAY